MSSLMPCPECGHGKSKVTMSRPGKKNAVRRTRECTKCKHHFQTRETYFKRFNLADFAVTNV